MPSTHKTHSGGFTRVDSADTGPAPHAKARPDFSLIFSIDANRVVRCCGTLITSLGARLVSTHAGVNHHPLSMEGKLVTQNVAVTVARLIVRSQGTTVEDQRATGLEAANHTVSTIREHLYLGHTLEALGISCIRQRQQLSGWARSAQCRVVEEGNLSVRMEDSLQELRHGTNLLRQQVRARKPLPCGCTQEPDFCQVVKDLGVIHRGALEVPAVRENLLVQFLLKQI